VYTFGEELNVINLWGTRGEKNTKRADYCISLLHHSENV